MRNIFIAALFFATQVFAADTVINTDKLKVGRKSSAAVKIVEFDINAGAANPKVQVNPATSKLQFTNDGTVFKDIGSGSGGGTGISVLSNGNFETGITDGWSNTGGTFANVTVAPNIINGLQSASFTASAGGQYFESASAVIPKALYGQDCMVKTLYTGADINGYLTVMDGSSVELIPTTARATLNATAGTKTAKVYFTCPSSGSIKLRVQSTAAMAIGYFDEAHLGSADYQPIKQAQFLGSINYVGTASCTWTTSSTSFVNFTANASCPTATASGSVLAPATKIPGVLIPYAPKGTYYIVANGSFQKLAVAADGSVLYRVSDGTNTSAPMIIRSNVNSTVGIGNYSGKISTTSDQTNLTIQVQARTDNASNATVLLDNGPTSYNFSMEVYFFPDGTDTVMNSKCSNDISCENNFSFIASSAGVVSNENQDFINGNCSVSDTSLYTCTFNLNIFTGAPNCSATLNSDASAASMSATVTNNSSSTVIVRTLAGGAKSAQPFSVQCQKSGPDYKSKQTIQGFLSGTVTSDNNVRIEKARFAGGTETTVCSTTPCTLYRATSGISSVTRTSTGLYVLNFVAGTFSTTPSCTYSGSNNVLAIIAISGAASTTAFNISTHSYSGGTATDTWIDLICVGVR